MAASTSRFILDDLATQREDAVLSVLQTGAPETQSDEVSTPLRRCQAMDPSNSEPSAVASRASVSCAEFLPVSTSQSSWSTPFYDKSSREVWSGTAARRQAEVVAANWARASVEIMDKLTETTTANVSNEVFPALEPGDIVIRGRDWPYVVRSIALFQ